MTYETVMMYFILAGASGLIALVTFLASSWVTDKYGDGHETEAATGCLGMLGCF